MHAHLKHIEADRYNLIRQIEKQISLDDKIKKIGLEVNDLQHNTRAAIEKIESYLSTKEKNISTVVRPVPPRNLKATPATSGADSHSIFLTWENCFIDGESPIVDYEVIYSVQDLEKGTLPKRRRISTNCSEWHLANSIPKGSFILNDVKAETLYTDIKIRCRNQKGWWSEFCSHPGGSVILKGKLVRLLKKKNGFTPLRLSTNIRKTAAIPPSIPERFAAFVLSSSCVRFEWAEPKCHNGKKNISIVGYDLVYHEKGRNDGKQLLPHHRNQQNSDTSKPPLIKHQIRLPASDRSYDLINLKPDTEYLNISLATVGPDGLISERIRCEDIKTMPIINSLSRTPENEIHVVLGKRYDDVADCDSFNAKSTRHTVTFEPRYPREESSRETSELSRREANFYFRINTLISEINSCKSAIEENMELRAKSVPKMIREQEIISMMKNELKRISDVKDTFVQSSVIHGTEQKFCTQELREMLQEKLQVSASVIEKLKAENISKERSNRTLVQLIEQKESLLQERKTALIMFKKQVKAAYLVSGQLPGNSDLIRKTYAAWYSCVKQTRDIRAALEAFELWNDRKCLNTSILHWREITKYYSRIEQRRKRESHVISKGGAWLIKSELSRLQVCNQIISEVTNISKKSLTSLEDKALLEDHLLACCEETFPLIKGDYHYHLEEYRDALQCYLDGMKFIMKYSLCDSDKMKLRCTVLNKIGRSAFAVNDISRAILAFEELQTVAKQLKHDIFIFIANLGLGKCYVLTQEWDLAEKYSNYCSNRVVEGSTLELYDESIKLLHRASQLRDANHTSCRFLNSKYCSTSKQIMSLLGKVNNMQVRIKNNSIYYGYGICFNRATCKYVKLKIKEQKLKTDLAVFMEKLEANKTEAQDLIRLITSIDHELRIESIRQGRSEGPTRRISSLVHDNIQSVDAVELSKRLTIRLEESKGALQDTRSKQEEIDIIIGTLNGELQEVQREYEIETGTLAMKHLLKHCIRLMVFNSIGSDCNNEEVDNVSKLVAISVGKDIFIYDTLTGDPIQVFEGDTLHGESSLAKGHSSIITSIFFQGKSLYSGAMDKKLCAWDVLSGNLLYVASGHDSTITCIVCDTMRGDTLISGSADKTLIVWRKCDGAQLHRLSGHSRGILSLDEAYCTIISGDADGDIFLWDTKEVSV